jgi:predicted protein tyrosine phosphatase
MNQWRSPTAEAIYRDDPRLEVRSAGIRSGAKRKLGVDDLEWANVVFVMEQEHKTVILEQFSGVKLPPVIVLDIPDSFRYMDTELQEILKTSIEAELEVFLSPEKGDA